MEKPIDLVYKGAEPLIVPDANLVAEPGGVYPIPAELAASLLARPDWDKAEKKATSKGA